MNHPASHPVPPAPAAASPTEASPPVAMAPEASGAPAPSNGAAIPPPSGPGSWLGALRTRLLRSSSVPLRATLEDALKAADNETTVSAEEREMLLRLLAFGALRVDDVMVPRADIIAIDEGAPLRELLATFDRAGVSRVPLYHETLDDPRGMVHTKDLMRWMMGGALGRPATEVRHAALPRPGHTVAKVPAGGVPAASPPEAAPLDFGKVDIDRTIASTKLRRPILYVPPSMPAMNLLIKMQASRMHMALVVDEYGGTDGLVTIEDLVEQIVGDISDEHDEAEAANITRDPKIGLVAAARTPVAELEAHVGMKLLTLDEEADVDTLGGLMFAMLGRVPVRGELVRHPSGLEFEVLDADARRVKKLRIHVPRTDLARADAAKAAAGKP